ncbi:MAG TPA: phosphoglucosamine mutase [Armatimonadota bacterium]
MGKLFGTDGVRGAANIDLTPDLALSLGRAAGLTLASDTPGAKVLIGRDTRASGDMLEAALAAGFCSAGVSVVSAGVITTPAVAMLTGTGAFAAGAVISASHNAAPENGIKFLGPDGAKLADATEQRIEDLLEAISNEKGPAPSGKVGRFAYDDSLHEQYAAACVRTCGATVRGIRIVVDGANGAGSNLNAAVLDRLGLDVHRINCAPDGANINADCGSTHPTALQVAVRGIGADLGAAFDGDGDRVILCASDGAIVDGDHVMAIFGHQWANSPKLPANTIVGTVMSNLGLEKCLSGIGVTLLRADVGDRYVAELMRQSGAAVGGEKSGHIILSRYATTGDGLLTLLQILAVMSESGRSLGDLASVMTEYPQILIGVRVRTKENWDQDAGVQKAIAQGNAALAGRGRLNVRPSGTESIVRIMAEGPDQDELHGIVHHIADAVRAHIGA